MTFVLHACIVKSCLLERVVTYFNKVKDNLKDNHMDKAPSNKPPALTESTNMGIWVVGTTRQLFIRDS